MPDPDPGPWEETTVTAHALREFAVSVLRDSQHLPLTRSAAGALGALTARGPLRITALAAAELVSQPAMTGLVQRLEAAGMVERTADPRDGRASLIAITDTGRAALQHRRRTHERIIAERLAGLSAEQHESLVRALPALAALSVAAS